MTDINTALDSAPVPLPTQRSHPFDPPAELGRFREAEPIRRLAYPDGHIGWLVTSHDLGRAVLADAAFSIRIGRDRSPVGNPAAAALKKVRSERAGTSAGNFLIMDPPEHTRFRRMLAGEFTVRQMDELRPRIEQIVGDHLDAMEQAGPPVDLVTSFALPIPSLTICEMLGVPYSDRDRFHRYSMAIESRDAGTDDIVAAYHEFRDLVHEVIDHERAQPGNGLLARLAATGELSEDELVGVGMLLVAAGHHTTKNMLALSTFALLSEPHRWEALRADPSLIANAVEELLRYLSTFQTAFTRTALEDVELGGVVVKAGESVTVSFPAANRDPARFDDPDVLSLTRHASGHVAFGHGIHMCLGQHLARFELQIGIAGLVRRFPTLRLAVPVDEVPVHPGDLGQAGVDRLPVAW